MRLSEGIRHEMINNLSLNWAQNKIMKVSISTSTMKEVQDLDFSWTCHECTFINENAASRKCIMCMSERPRNQVKQAVDMSDMSERPRKQAKQAVDSFLDVDRKPTWEEKKLIEEWERQAEQAVDSSFLAKRGEAPIVGSQMSATVVLCSSLDSNVTLGSSLDSSLDSSSNNVVLDSSLDSKVVLGLSLDSSLDSSSMESMEVEPYQTTQETISALQEKIARLQQQIEEQERRPIELNNANQVKRNVGLSWSFNKDDPVPDDIVSELYKQLKVTRSLIF